MHGDYVIAFKSTNAHSNAAALGKLPLSDKPGEVPVSAPFILLIEHVLDAPVKAHEICIWTRKDLKLSQVLQFIQYG